jgi:TRAP-type C4-dicarboxylate transport system permease small subunit
LQFIDWLIDRTRKVSRVTIWIAGAFMIATVFMIGAEIILRKLGSGMISGASEIGGYMLAICTVWAFSFTLLSGSNIRFDILYVRCRPRTRAVMDLLALLAMGIFIYTVTFHGYAVLATSIGFDTRSTSGLSVPMWIPQSIWFAGLGFLCWTILILTVRVTLALWRGDFDTVTRLAGTETVAEEAEREARALAGGGQ